MTYEQIEAIEALYGCGVIVARPPFRFSPEFRAVLQRRIKSFPGLSRSSRYALETRSRLEHADIMGSNIFQTENNRTCLGLKDEPFDPDPPQWEVGP